MSLRVAQNTILWNYATLWLNLLRIWTCIHGYYFSLSYSEFRLFYIHMIFCRNLIAIWLVWSGRQCRPLGPAVPPCAVSARILCAWTDKTYHMHHVYSMTLCSTLHSRHGCRGRLPSHLKCESWPFYAKLRIQIFIHIFRGRLLHPWFKNLSLDFISFVSSNWVVINYQKGGDCKCNQALLWVLLLMTTKLEDWWDLSRWQAGNWKMRMMYRL